MPFSRIAREQRTIDAMLRLYCRDHHGGSRDLCDDCATLLDYARRRLSTCPFGASKPACNHCPVHCYSRARRLRIKAVMRYSGPRLLLRHPLLSLFHLLDRWRKPPAPTSQRQGRSDTGAADGGRAGRPPPAAAAANAPGTAPVALGGRAAPGTPPHGADGTEGAPDS